MGYFKWDSDESNLHINVKEFYIPLNVIAEFGNELSGNTLQILNDNQSVVYSMRKMWSKSKDLMNGLIELAFLLFKYKLKIRANYIMSLANILPDALLRFQLNKFQDYASFSCANLQNKPTKVFFLHLMSNLPRCYTIVEKVFFFC